METLRSLSCKKFRKMGILIQLFMWILKPGPSQAGGPGRHMPPHFLADQLTLSQPGRAHYPHLVLPAPPRIFRPCDGPVMWFDIEKMTENPVPRLQMKLYSLRNKTLKKSRSYFSFSSIYLLPISNDLILWVPDLIVLLWIIWSLI